MTAASSFHDEPQPTEPAREIVPFGDAIRQAAYEAVPQAKFIASVFDPIADAVQAMPEMRAIREVLAEVLDSTAYGCPYLLQDGSEGTYGPNTCNQGCRDEPECMTGDFIKLPKSVRQWATSWATS